MQSPEPGTEQAEERDGAESGTGQDTGIEAAADTEPGREHVTSEERDTLPGIAEEPGTTNQESDIELPTNPEGTTTATTVREPEATNQETDIEVPTNPEGTTSAATFREPLATNQETNFEVPTNLEGTTSGATVQEPEATNQETDIENATDTTIAGGTGIMVEQEEAADHQQDMTSPEPHQEELGPETSPDLDATAEEELNVTGGAEGIGIAGYQQRPHEFPEEQEDTPYPPEAQEDEEPHQEQWPEDTEPGDISSEDEQVREALIQQYQYLVSEKEKIQQQNSQLQHKLYEYFRRKKGEETRAEVDKHVSDQEQRYLKYLATLEEMRKKVKVDSALHEQQIETLNVQCQEAVSQVDKEWAAFQEQKKKIALYVVNCRAGKHTTSSFAQEVLQLQAKEERKEKEVIQVRLENIKLKNQIHHYESTLRSKEELADGLHLIDFEQLKIENQTYNEKIEERNEELLKLRKKITNTVQVLTHLKEKLQYMQAENQDQKDRLMDIEAMVAHKRDILTRTKQARDSLRMDNLNLKQRCGLLGNKTLLRDFEEKVDATEELSQKLENLKRRHAELTLSSRGMMKKIEDTKLVMES